jgi:hypothetical protein
MKRLLTVKAAADYTFQSVVPKNKRGCGSCGHPTFKCGD